MRDQLLIFVFGCLILLAACSDDDQIGPAGPADQLAFYMIEGYHDKLDLSTVTIDSIKEFGDLTIGYNDIVKYDTSNFIMELTPSGKERFDSVYLARYARHYPLALMVRGEFLFSVYISHGALSSIANWYSLKPYYEVAYPNNYIQFSPPPFMNISAEPDYRKDPRILQVLKEGRKLK